MTTVGIIAEYNPFHKGHAYQIKSIRQAFGEDTRIVAVMSGHYPQRGDIAIADKFTRAAAAVASGVNLVLELPFPFSGESAPVFARAGVKILADCRIDVLSFGSECGDLSALMAASAVMDDEALRERLFQETRSKKNGYPKETEALLRLRFGDAVAELYKSPNNLLAMEYIRAAKAICPTLSFHTVKRVGSLHGDTVLSSYSSSTAIRTSIQGGDLAGALEALPETARPYYEMALSQSTFPSDLRALDAAVLSYFCIKAPDGSPDIADAGGGLYRRLFCMAEKATDIDSLILLTATKRYTKARIRRALRNTVLGVTSSDIEEAPLYTQLLAFDEVGQMIARDIKSLGRISLLTKPADAACLPVAAKRQAYRSMRADSLYTLTLRRKPPRDLFLRCSPYRITAKSDENFSRSSFVEGIDKPCAE